MDENQMNENGIGRKALDQNPLDEKRLDENWAHDVDNSKYLFVIIPILLTLVIVYAMLMVSFPILFNWI